MVVSIRRFTERPRRVSKLARQIVLFGVPAVLVQVLILGAVFVLVKHAREGTSGQPSSEVAEVAQRPAEAAGRGPRQDEARPPATGTGEGERPRPDRTRPPEAEHERPAPPTPPFPAAQPPGPDAEEPHQEPATSGRLVVGVGREPGGWAYKVRLSGPNGYKVPVDGVTEEWRVEALSDWDGREASLGTGITQRRSGNGIEIWGKSPGTGEDMALVSIRAEDGGLLFQEAPAASPQQWERCLASVAWVKLSHEPSQQTVRVVTNPLWHRIELTRESATSARGGTTVPSLFARLCALHRPEYPKHLKDEGDYGAEVKAVLDGNELTLHVDYSYETPPEILRAEEELQTARQEHEALRRRHQEAQRSVEEAKRALETAERSAKIAAEQTLRGARRRTGTQPAPARPTDRQARALQARLAATTQQQWRRAEQSVEAMRQAVQGASRKVEAATERKAALEKVEELRRDVAFGRFDLLKFKVDDQAIAVFNLRPSDLPHSGVQPARRGDLVGPEQPEAAADAGPPGEAEQPAAAAPAEPSQQAGAQIEPTTTFVARISTSRGGLAGKVAFGDDGGRYEMPLDALTEQWHVLEMGTWEGKAAAQRSGITQSTRENAIELRGKHPGTGDDATFVTIRPLKGALLFQKAQGVTYEQLRDCLADIAWIKLYYEPRKDTVFVLTKPLACEVQLEAGAEREALRGKATIPELFGQFCSAQRLEHGSYVTDEAGFKARVRARLAGTELTVNVYYSYGTPAGVVAARTSQREAEQQLPALEAELRRATQRVNAALEDLEEANKKAWELRQRVNELREKAKKAAQKEAELTQLSRKKREEGFGRFPEPLELKVGDQAVGVFQLKAPGS